MQQLRFLVSKNYWLMQLAIGNIKSCDSEPDGIPPIDTHASIKTPRKISSTVLFSQGYIINSHNLFNQEFILLLNFCVNRLHPQRLADCKLYKLH